MVRDGQEDPGAVPPAVEMLPLSIASEFQKIAGAARENPVWARHLMVAVLALNVGSTSRKASGFVLRSNRPQRVFTAQHDLSAGGTELVARIDSPLGDPGAGYSDGALALVDLAERTCEAPLMVGHRIVHGEDFRGRRCG